MRILGNSSSRLTLLLPRWGIAGTICRLDRRSNSASVTQHVLFVPFHRAQVPLSTVVGTNVQKTGPDGTHRYSPILKLRFGRRLQIAQRTKEEAIAVAKTIRDFLEIH